MRSKLLPLLMLLLWAANVTAQSRRDKVQSQISTIAEQQRQVLSTLDEIKQLLTANL